MVDEAKVDVEERASLSSMNLYGDEERKKEEFGRSGLDIYGGGWGVGN